MAPDIKLYVFDTRGEAMEPFVKRGATACASPTLVANSAEIIFASLFGLNQVPNLLAFKLGEFPNSAAF